jgi:cyanophycinase-like exopeptidase
VAARRQNRNRGPVQVVYLPCNAADDGLETIECWSGEAQTRLEVLGAQVAAPPVIDRRSADDPAYAAQVRSADWIYLGGGKPQVGMRILPGTQVYRALREAWEDGALLCGASAGAMLLAGQSWVITDELDPAIEAMQRAGRDPQDWELPRLDPLACLGLLPNTLIWPHLNQFFALNWLKQGMKPPGHTVIGIDEQTALLSGGNSAWQVLGRGRAVLIDDEYQVQSFSAGESLHFRV